MMCRNIVGWEPDPSVEGTNNMRPISCSERSERLAARVIELENLLAVGGIESGKIRGLVSRTGTDKARDKVLLNDLNYQPIREV